MTHAGTCTKCGSRQADGTLISRDSNMARYKAEWAEGRPERSFWNGLRLRGLKRYAVHARRCGKCGLLEIYASE